MLHGYNIYCMALVGITWIPLTRNDRRVHMLTHDYINEV